MKKHLLTIGSLLMMLTGFAQEIIPLDTNRWEMGGSYVTEDYQGKSAIYLKRGSISLKDIKFLNGTIEYDIYLKEVPAFPGVSFRVNGQNDEKFYIRPHQSGNPDANQATPTVNGITPWQLYFGPRYSFPYNYNFDDWTHVKIVVKDDKAQVFLDYSKTPHLSWNLFHEPKAGGITLTAGGAQAMHVADIKIDSRSVDLVNFQPIDREPIEGLIEEWEISDKFEEELLEDHKSLGALIKDRKWGRKIQVEEGTAANISRKQQLRNGEKGNTVFARVTINSDRDQIKLFEFGYSDRVVAILEGKAIYRGNNRWRSRDYRYLGTIGLFDGIYLNLKKGENMLLFAVSEDFGGWLITGRFVDDLGVKVKP